MPSLHHRLKVYIAGPITGVPDLNRVAFDAAAAKLEAAGIPFFHPLQNGVHVLAPWQDHMREDIRQMMICSHILLLDGWEQSEGARLEVHIADALGIARFDLRPLLEKLLPHGAVQSEEQA